MSSKLLTLLRRRGDDGYAQYATADGMSFRDAIEAEQLLKAADDLTNDTYWATDASITVTDQGSGVFRIADAVSGALYQILTNWFPAFAGQTSIELEVRAGTLDQISLGMLVDGGWGTHTAEIISGPGSTNSPAAVIAVSGLETDQWTKVRVSKSLAGWATSVWALFYPGTTGAETGYIEVRNLQVILGDTAKPRPTQTSPDDWMMAYRPHNRVTADGAARYSVVDSEGLVSVGDCTDIALSPATNTDLTTNSADQRVSMAHTAETGKIAAFYLRYTDGNNTVKCTFKESGNVVEVREYVGGVLGAAEDLSITLTNGTAYRTHAEITGTTLSVYGDDKLLGTVTVSASLTGTSIRIAHNQATAPTYAVAESYPRKATGIIKAGGVATPAWGDPGIWFTQPDGSAFAVGASDAVMFTAKTFVASKEAVFGIDGDTSGNVVVPRFRLNSSKLYMRSASYFETPQTWTAGTTKTFMQLLRSDTHGSQFLLHDSGKQWTRFNVNDDAIPAASAYPAVSNYNAALFLTDFALLDLDAIHDAEFCEVTDTKTNPADLTYFDVTADCEINTSFTFESTKYINFYFRMNSDDSEYMVILVNTDGNVLLRKRVGGTTSNVATTGGGTLSDGVAYSLDVVANGTSVKLYIDKTLEIDGVVTDSVLLANAKGLVGNDYATNDIVLTTHPYPALGGSKLGATDRVVAPQDGDTASVENDSLVIFRKAQIPAASASIRIRGQATGSNVRFEALNTGAAYISNYTSGSWASSPVSGGAFSNDDDVMTVLSAADGELFYNGASVGSSAAVNNPGGPGLFEAVSTTVLCNAVELWKEKVNFVKV